MEPPDGSSFRSIWHDGSIKACVLNFATARAALSIPHSGTDVIAVHTVCVERLVPADCSSLALETARGATKSAPAVRRVGLGVVKATEDNRALAARFADECADAV